MRILFLTLMMSFLSHSAFGGANLDIENLGEDLALSPFYEAVESGDIPMVNHYLDVIGEDINQIDEDGATPLKIAAFAQQHTMFLHLISRGANLDLEIQTHEVWIISMVLCSLRHGS